MERGRCIHPVWMGVSVLLAMGLLALPGAAQTTDLAGRGRELVSKYSDAVVTVKLAVKVRMAMEGKEQEEESSSEITATMIDPSGLAVCALSEADPTNAIAQMTSEEQDFKFEMDITDVKMRLADGTELPAKVVLRDKDLDLAFVRVTTPPAKPLPAIDLTAGSPTDVLDEVVILNRMGEVANRVPAVLVDRIVGVIRKPRLMYVPGPVGQYSNLGCPVLTLDGKIVGVIVNRFPPQAGGTSREERSPLSVVMPADDVSEVAKQAAAVNGAAPAEPAK